MHFGRSSTKLTQFRKTILLLLTLVMIAEITERRRLLPASRLIFTVHPIIQPVLSFAPITAPMRNSNRKFINNNFGVTSDIATNSILHSSNKRQQEPSASCEFELQELRAQFRSFLKQNIRPKMLPLETRDIIESFVKKVLDKCPSPIALKSLASDGAKVLHGKWTLVFASQNASLGDLPRDSTVQLIVYPNFQCDYKIQFAKSFGIQSLTAKSSFLVDATPVNAGLFTLIYKEIVADVFGFKSIPVGLFGLLKGRANYIETIWFDGNLWVERGYGPKGDEYFNVYMREQ